MVHVFGYSPKGWNPNLELAVLNGVPPGKVAQLRIRWVALLASMDLRRFVADLFVEKIINVFLNESFPSRARRLRRIKPCLSRLLHVSHKARPSDPARLVTVTADQILLVRGQGLQAFDVSKWAQPSRDAIQVEPLGVHSVGSTANTEGMLLQSFLARRRPA